MISWDCRKLETDRGIEKLNGNLIDAPKLRPIKQLELNSRLSLLFVKWTCQDVR